VASDLDLAGQDDAQGAAAVTDLGERLARRKRAQLAEAPDPLDFRWIERREHLILARVGDRWGRHGCLRRGS
jgi:hypothetical protein